ncbi:MAG: class I SAM-dependent methyltransferase [Nibricoccus sp.]
MNNLDNGSCWDAYFKYRSVDKSLYKDHKLANYVAACLPKESSATIADLGCGFGQNLLAMRKMGYTNCYGVEPSEEASAWVASQGIDVFRTTIEKFASERPRLAKFVLMTHVLEHIPKDRVIPVLSQIRESILDSDGMLLVAVPNAASVTHCYWRYEDWTHTCLFTSGSLLFVLQAAGFSNIEIIDPDSMMKTRPWVRPLRRACLSVYKRYLNALCRLTDSSFHKSSPLVLSFEVKALAKK